MLLKENCTVTMAHSKTRNLEAMLKSYDIIVVAVGKPKLIDLAKCEAQIVVDVGVNRVDGKLCGDCFNFDEKLNDGMLVTPVPKGIGLMTRAMLMKHISEINQKEV
jgi:methylenetetrahydrofolate dehydrogenase (NADP+)/methenyltetrahydrofolate cyclohydrolase